MRHRNVTKIIFNLGSKVAKGKELMNKWKSFPSPVNIERGLSEIFCDKVINRLYPRNIGKFRYRCILPGTWRRSKLFSPQNFILAHPKAKRKKKGKSVFQIFTDNWKNRKRIRTRDNFIWKSYTENFVMEISGEKLTVPPFKTMVINNFHLDKPLNIIWVSLFFLATNIFFFPHTYSRQIILNYYLR